MRGLPEQDRRDERPAHAVMVGAFLVARRPVSNAQYARYVEAAGVAPPPFWAQDGFCGADKTVVGVSWHDAVFCAWLSEQGETRFRLPTEAEREFAARGGIEAAAWPEIDDAWPDAEVRRAVALAEAPHAAARCLPQRLRAVLHGRQRPRVVLRLVRPLVVRALAERGANRPAEIGQRRASRGGSWRHRVKFTRVSARSSLPPSYRYNDYGFRVYADPAPRALHDHARGLRQED